MNDMSEQAWRTRGGPVKWPLLSENGLRIRPARPDDADRWFAIRMSAGPWQSPLSSVSAARELLEAMAGEPAFSPGWRQFMVEEKGAVIGDIGLDWPADGDLAELGFEMAPEARGRGLAASAITPFCGWLLETAGLTGIVAITHRDNLAAQKALLAAAFVPSSDPALQARFAVQSDELLHLRTKDA